MNKYQKIADEMKQLAESPPSKIRADQGKVPDDFPEMRVISRIGSEGGKPYKPYYRAREVWKWFRSSNKMSQSTNKEDTS